MGGEGISREGMKRNEIAVKDTSVVKMFETEENLSSVKANARFGEPLLPLKVVEQFPTVHEIEDQVKLEKRETG